MGQDRAVSIATCQGLDGPRIESRRGRDFPQRSKLALGPIQPTAKWLLDLFPRENAARAWRGTPTPSSAEVKERVKLYIYSPSDPSLSILE